MSEQILFFHSGVDRGSIVQIDVPEFAVDNLTAFDHDIEGLAKAFLVLKLEKCRPFGCQGLGGFFIRYSRPFLRKAVKNTHTYKHEDR